MALVALQSASRLSRLNDVACDLARRSLRCARSVLLSMGLAVAAVPAHAYLIDFESIADGDAVTNQYAGVVFSNAIALQAGGSLNEFEFPPRSGSTVAFDDGGPIVVTFSDAQQAFQAYFTYAAPLTVSAFDLSNNLLGSVTSSFSSNLLLSGDLGSVPNELLALSFSGIRSVSITGAAAGASFTMDDLDFVADSNGGGPRPIPEPSALALCLLALAAGVAVLRAGSRDGTIARKATGRERALPS